MFNAVHAARKLVEDNSLCTGDEPIRVQATWVKLPTVLKADRGNEHARIIDNSNNNNNNTNILWHDKSMEAEAL